MIQDMVCTFNVDVGFVEAGVGCLPAVLDGGGRTYNHRPVLETLLDQCGQNAQASVRLRIAIRSTLRIRGRPPA